MVLSAVHALLRSERAAIASGAMHAEGKLRKQMSAVIAIAEGPASLLESERDAQVHGAVAALLGGRLRETLVDAWLATGGAPFALAAAVHERRLVVAYPKKPGGGLDLSVRWLAPRTPEQTPLALDLPTWDTLRAAFRRLKKTEKEDAQGRARAIREDVPLSLACWIDGIAHLVDEAAADGPQLVDLGDREWSEVEPWLLRLLPALSLSPSEDTREAALAIVERVAAGSSNVNQMAPYAKEVIDLVGAPILPALFRMLTAAHRSTVAEESKATKVAQAIARVEDPAVGQFFATYVNSRLFGAVAAEYVIAHAPVGTAPPTAVIERAALFKAVTAVKARERAKKTKAVAKKTKAASVIAAAAPAATSELPWVLREPPWRAGSALPVVQAIGALTPIAYTETVHLSESDREGVDDEDTTPVGLLVRRGLRAVDTLIERNDDAAFYALRRVDSPRVARAMAQALPGPRSKLASQWFESYPEAAAIGLLPLALRGTPAERVLVAPALRRLGGVDVPIVREVGARFGPDAAAAMDDLGTFLALLDCPSEPPELPKWASPTRLPKIALAEGRLLPEDAVLAILEMLAFNDATRAHVGLEQVRASCDPVLLDAFLVALVEARLKAGSESDDWTVRGAALLGGADAARAFAKWIKAWSRERSPAARARAVVLVEALGKGNDDAITVLAALPRKGVRGSVGEVAEDVLRDVARKKGLAQEDLTDLVVPTFDLPPDGRLTLDFGGRSFEVRVDDALVPHVHDSEGRRVTAALRAKKTDDPTKSRASLDRLRSLKKGLAELARTLAARFDHAMASGRRWRASVFASTIVLHPLLSRLARGLVWARVDGRTGAMIATFRVTEDGTFADANDEPIACGERDAIILPHPLEVDSEVLARWAAVFGDYELVPPFQQIGRATFDPTPKERQANLLSRFAGEPTTQMALAGRLEARGWQRLADEGIVRGYTKTLRTVTAHYALVDPLVFAEGFVNETTVGTVSFGVPLEQVPAVAFSEAAFDLSVFGLR